MHALARAVRSAGAIDPERLEARAEPGEVRLQEERRPVLGAERLEDAVTVLESPVEARDAGDARGDHLALEPRPVFARPVGHGVPPAPARTSESARPFVMLS